MPYACVPLFACADNDSGNDDNGADDVDDNDNGVDDVALAHSKICSEGIINDFDVSWPPKILACCEL